MPIARHPLVKRIWIVRSHQSEFGEIPKSKYLLAPSLTRLGRFAQMYRHCRWLAQRPELRLFVSYNPFPYGLISMLAARSFRIPVHFGFIGTDWNYRATGPFSRLLLPFARRAWLISAPGPSMRAQMLASGFDPKRTISLPHCIELERFPIRSSANPRYQCIFVGRLDRNKRVDVILRAFSRVVAVYPTARLCIAGDGVLREKLECLTHELGLSTQVDFVGQVAYVSVLLGESRMIVVASESEGFPVAMVEAMVSGLVPVSTPVGTIPDKLIDGKGGFLVPVGDYIALADRVCELIDNADLYRHMRENVLKMRTEFGYATATQIWDTYLRRLIDSPQPV